MEISEQDDYGGFEVIEDFNISISEPPKIKQQIIYDVKINPSKNQVDLNILENQYYDFVVHQLEKPYCSIQRTSSQFDTIFKILQKKQSGYIFPAFPQNSIFTFMKTKVTAVKDTVLIARRQQVIERFFNIILNNPIFNPLTCKQMKEFLSTGKEFDARTQIENNSGEGVFSFTWNKIKGIFTLNNENKYLQTDKQIDELKIREQFLYTKCRQLIDLMKEELLQNEKLSDLNISNTDFFFYKNFISEQEIKTNQLLKEFYELQLSLFCQNQDLSMGKRVINRINELNKDEDNYQQLKSIQQQFNSRFSKFFSDKEIAYQKNQDQLRKLVKKLKQVGRMIA